MHAHAKPFLVKTDINNQNHKKIIICKTYRIKYSYYFFAVHWLLFFLVLESESLLTESKCRLSTLVYSPVSRSLAMSRPIGALGLV